MFLSIYKYALSASSQDTPPCSSFSSHSLILSSSVLFCHVWKYNSNRYNICVIHSKGDIYSISDIEDFKHLTVLKHLPLKKEIRIFHLQSSNAKSPENIWSCSLSSNKNLCYCCLAQRYIKRPSATQPSLIANIKNARLSWSCINN